MPTKSITRDIVVSSNKIFRKPKPDVLILEYQNVFEDYVAIRIIHQDEGIFKRGEFKDTSLNVYSGSYFDYDTEYHALYLRGDMIEEDNKVILLPKMYADMIKERVAEINKEYKGFKKEG